MTAPERILTYIQKTYQPEAVVVYGSFADGSAGAGSDFDALVIAGSRACHDASEIDGVTLFNPGCCGRFTSHPSYGVIETDHGQFTCRVCDCD